MKTSNRILFITGITIVVIIFIAVLGSRLFLIKYTYSPDNNEYTSTEWTEDNIGIKFSYTLKNS